MTRSEQSRPVWLRARTHRRVRAVRRGSAASVVLLVLAGLVVGISASPADAAPGPWTWVKATASGTTSSQGAFITATCPTGYQAISGGVNYTDVISSAQVSGRNYTVQAFDFGDHRRLDVTAWCARSDQVDVEVDVRTLRTDRSGQFDAGLGIGDFACSGDRTPVSASMTWRSDAQYSIITQSGPELVGGTYQWFITALGASTSSVLDVKLNCVPTADLAGATWTTQSAALGQSGTITATCPAGQRLVTGGEHIDSIHADAYSSLPVDSRTWTSTAYVPSGDFLSVSVLCVPAGDPVATITSGPPRATNSTTATFTFDAVDPSGGNAYDFCFLNTSGLGTCSGSYTITGLTEGENVFSIEAYTDDGRGWASTEKDYYFWVDVTPPTVALAKPPLFTLGTAAPLRATGADNQGVDHYTYSVTARPTAGPGASTAHPVTTTYTRTTGKLSLAVKPGTYYRVVTRDVDAATNVSTKASVGITAVPLDNLDLAASNNWTLIKGSVYTNNLVSRTRTKGATLTEPLYGTTIGVVATTCPTCGQIGVYSGTKLLATVNLHASATHYQQVMAIPVGPDPIQTTVKLKVLSTNKLVEIDGLGAVIN